MPEEPNRWESVYRSKEEADDKLVRGPSAGIARPHSGYRLVRSLSHEHRTPWGSVQRFHFGLFQKV